MARPRSEDKKIAILEATMEAIAEAGLGVSTALIARKAGVAEGTVFRYFTTKDELYNMLFIHLKQEICQSLNGGVDRSRDNKSNIRHIWNSFIDWGLANPQANLTLRKLEVSNSITEESEKAVKDLYPELTEVCDQSLSPILREPQYSKFGNGIFFALAQTTMDFATQEPDRADDYKSVGFDAMWRTFGIRPEE